MLRNTHMMSAMLLGLGLTIAPPIANRSALADHLPPGGYFQVDSFSFGSEQTFLDLECDGIIGPKTMTAFRSQLDAAHVRIPDGDLTAVVRHVVNNSRRASANATKLTGCVNFGRICYDIACGGRR